VRDPPRVLRQSVNAVDDVPGRDDRQLDELLGAARVGDHHVLGGRQGLELAQEAEDDALVGVADPAADAIDEDVLVLLDEARR